jgi:DNA-directed RNA polymerase specialized sigma24 family protein
LDFNQFLSKDYPALLGASNNITGNNKLAPDLLHYAIEEMSYKPNLQEIVDSGGARFYCIRIMMTQWRSQTGPFHKQFRKVFTPIEGLDIEEELEEGLDITRIHKILNELPWYDRELFKLYTEGRYNYSKLSVVTGIPRTSIALTIKRVRKHIKKNL